MEEKIYTWPQAFNGLVSSETVFYQTLLHDAQTEENTELADQFNDLYHLFLNKFARLSQESTLSTTQEQELKVLLSELLIVRRALENDSVK